MTHYLRAKRTYELLLLNGYRFIDGRWIQIEPERKVHATA